MVFLFEKKIVILLFKSNQSFYSYFIDIKRIKQL